LEPEILIVDEVLAVGDAQFQKKCLGKMGDVAKEGRTVLFVSHNLPAIVSFCQHTFVIDAGKLIYSGISEDSVKHYMKLFSRHTSDNSTHVLYQGCSVDQVAQVRQIEIYDRNGSPKPTVYTWDDVVLRIYYESFHEIRSGAFVVDIWDSKQQRLLVLDSGSKLTIQKGEHWVECFIPRIPLPAGEYYLGAGLAVSRMNWLWRERNLARFVVHGKDVLALGRPPTTERMLFVAEHQWRMNKES
jgi:lipopolysaccharide transport system ATP-binding protein